MKEGTKEEWNKKVETNEIREKELQENIKGKMEKTTKVEEVKCKE